jgi:hypothetical protein
MCFFEYAIVDIGDNNILDHAVAISAVMCEKRNLCASTVRVSPLARGALYPVMRTVSVCARFLQQL